MGVSLVGCYHYRRRRLVAYRGDRKGDLVRLEAELRAADLVIGFKPVPPVLSAQRPAATCCTMSPVRTTLPVASTSKPPSGMAGPPWSRK